MATIRAWLNAVEFDWEKGRIVYQAITETAYPAPGWAHGDDLLPTVEIQADHPILDHDFDSGYGSPSCPRFYAEDTKAIYHPSQYDGATGIEVVLKGGVDAFLDNPTEPLPYPGG